MTAALLTTGRRTVANLLRTLGALAPGHRTSYQRVLSAASWSGPRLGLRLTHFLLRHLPSGGPVLLVGDDTVDGHKGKHVCGKARHRDPVRSTKSYTAWRYGHKWVVLAILVRFPFATRPWALPVLVDLYRSAEDNRQRKRPHRTPAQLMCRLLRLLLLRCPGRRFVFALSGPAAGPPGLPPAVPRAAVGNQVVAPGPPLGEVDLQGAEPPGPTAHDQDVHPVDHPPQHRPQLQARLVAALADHVHQRRQVPPRLLRRPGGAGQLLLQLLGDPLLFDLPVSNGSGRSRR
jgi:hypothetical protein